MRLFLLFLEFDLHLLEIIFNILLYGVYLLYIYINFFRLFIQIGKITTEEISFKILYLQKRFIKS